MSKYEDILRGKGREAITDDQAAMLGQQWYKNLENGNISADGFASNLMAKWFGQGMTNQQKMQSYVNIAEAQKSRDWEERMSSTANQRAVADMKAAGLNPALMYGSGSPASTPSAATASAAPADSGGFSFQDLISLISLPVQLAQMQANVANTRAATTKMNTEVDLNKIEFAWRERTLDTRVRSAELVNEASEENIRQVRDNRGLIRENVNKVVAETKNEQERFFLIGAEKRLADANEKSILAMLPYQQLLAQAQTETQKAQALASTIHAMYEQRLIDAGMIEQQIDAMRKQASAALTSAGASKKMADVNAALQGFKESVYTGKVWNPDNYSGVNKYLAKGLNAFTSAVSTLTTAIGGPLAGLVH